jgi:hypothetical protein
MLSNADARIVLPNRASIFPADQRWRGSKLLFALLEFNDCQSIRSEIKSQFAIV